MSSKSLIHLDKEYLYVKEQEEVLLDTLNLYYVAFTRAIDQLYISFIDNEKKNDFPKQFVSCIKNNKNYIPRLMLYFLMIQMKWQVILFVKNPILKGFSFNQIFSNS